MQRRISFIFFLIILTFFLTPTPTLATKKRVWGKTITTPTARSSQLSVTAKFTGWKQYLNVNFKGLNNTKGVTYELIYASNGLDQGGGGRIEANTNAVSRNIFLGSCSHAVCTPHKNISNVRLTINYLSTSGQNITKSYRVKY